MTVIITFNLTALPLIFVQYDLISIYLYIKINLKNIYRACMYNQYYTIGSGGWAVWHTSNRHPPTLWWVAKKLTVAVLCQKNNRRVWLVGGLDVRLFYFYTPNDSNIFTQTNTCHFNSCIFISKSQDLCEMLDRYYYVNSIVDCSFNTKEHNVIYANYSSDLDSCTVLPSSVLCKHFLWIGVGTNRDT